MPRFQINLGSFRENALPTSLPMRLVGRALEEYFADLGGDDVAGPLVDLVLDTDNVADANTSEPDRPTFGLDLHLALKRLTGIRPNQAGFRNTVGVIYADSFAPQPSLFGLMFDPGFADSETGSTGRYLHSAREGCAVFVDAINDKRIAEQRERQILWTTIHEIGHLFNLWHVPSPVRFLTQSSAAGVFDPAAPLRDENGQPLDIQYAFHEEHRQFLAACLAEGPDGENASFAWPGGTAYGKRGQKWSVDKNLGDGLRLPRSRAAIELRIDMHQREIFPFDPVEMDIGLYVPRDIEKTYRLPSHVDPGYETFSIWIEEPDGHRVRYRSPRLYCENPGVIRVDRQNPFERDLSIFGQSGGYTFRKPGEHTLFATWILPGGRVLESNRIEIYVKGWLDDAREYAARQQILTRRKVAKLLYHRAGPADRHATEPIEALVDATHDPQLEVNLRYALGRFYARVGVGRARSTRREYERRARRHLDTALQNQPVLSPRRCHHCQRVLDEISQS